MGENCIASRESEKQSLNETRYLLNKKVDNVLSKVNLFIQNILIQNNDKQEIFLKEILVRPNYNVMIENNIELKWHNFFQNYYLA